MEITQTNDHAVASRPTDWVGIQRSAEFQDLRRRHRGFAFPLTAFFIVWYVAYLLLADYAHGVMAVKVAGNVTLGLLLGILQFVTTFLVTAGYVWFAGRRLDPLAAQIRDDREESP